MDTVQTTEPRISVLGPIVASVDDETLNLGGPKQRAVLAMLVANHGELIGSGNILTSIWGEDAPESYRRSLQTYVSNLRAILAVDITRAGDGYRLEIADSQVDALVFERRVQSAVELISTDPDTAGDQLRQALGLWRGRPYADVFDVEGLQAEIRRLEDLRLSAVEARVEADLAAGRHQQILAETGALAEEHPLRERFRAQHMLALYRSGRQAEALRAYQKTKDYLADELGLEPSQELQDLELAILEQDELLDLGPDRARTEQLAFLVTRIGDSSDTWDRHPQIMAEALKSHDRILREAVEEVGGHLFKQTGYGTVAAFGNAPAAVKAAERAQRDMAAIEWGDAGKIGVRMGIDAGEAETRGGDFKGPPLNRASRLSVAAHSGQVLVSTAAQREIAEASPAGVQIRQLGEHKLTGFSTPERIGQLVIDGLASDFPELRMETDDSIESDLYLSLPGYELRERIGEGTFGVVHRAYQPSVGREVAVKIIRPQLADHPQFVQRFETEARKIAHLTHPRVLPLIDFWRDPEGAYLVLQLVRGGSLEDRMRDGYGDDSSCVDLLSQIGEALDYAQRQGISHGDLKPENVLLDESGNAYVSDFAIASRLLEPSLVDSISPKSEFRAPEQPGTGPTAMADVYALGIIARKLIDNPAAEPVLSRATTRDPDDRYSTSGDFLADLQDALGLKSVEISHVPVTRNPYKGLRPFDEADESDFHGRDDLVETLQQTLANHRFVTLVGASGSGKSSAVRAGLLPALASGGVRDSEHWLRAIFTPGPSPVASLLEALKSLDTTGTDLAGALEEGGLGAVARRIQPDGADLLIVIDQFEEIFAQVDDPARREAFIRHIVDPVDDRDSRVRVVATLRADFYDGPLRHSGLDRLFRDGHVMLLQPSREELIQMISRPAQAVGLRWEPGLPERIAHDVLDQPGGLPLLQYALTEMVEKRKSDLLTTRDYERIGGVAGALSHRAEAVYQDLTPKQKHVCHQVLLRLVQVDDSSDDTRRRARRSELESLGIDPVDLDTVLGSLTAERLLLADRDQVTRTPTVEVAHEALLREWPRLKNWIDDERHSLLVGRRFRAARREWVSSGRNSDYLLTGSRLAPFLDWGETAPLSDEEREFYVESRKADERRRHARQRRRRLLAGILGVAVVLASALAIWALTERNRATEQAEAARIAEQQAEELAAAALQAEEQAEAAARIADRNAAVARSRELAASAINVLDDDPRLAKLLALEAATIADPPLEVVSAMHQAFRADRILDEYSWPADIPLGALWTDLHPSGERLVASGSGPGPVGATSSHLEVFSLKEDDVLWSWDAGSGIALSASFFSPDGDIVMVGAVAHPSLAETPEGVPGIYLFDNDTGEEVSRLDVGACGGLVADVSEALVLVVTVNGSPGDCFLDKEAEYRYELVDVATGDRRVISTSESSTRFPTVVEETAALSDDGAYVAYESPEEDGGIRVVVADTRTLDPVLEFIPDLDETTPFIHDLNEDGSLLLYGWKTVQAWDVESNTVLAQLTRDTTGQMEATFGPDESSFYVTGQDSLLRRVDIARGIERELIPATGPGPISASDDELLLITLPTDRKALAISESPKAEVTSFDVPECFIATGGIEVSRNMLAVNQGCPEAQYTNVTNASTGDLIYSLPGAGGQSFSISPDGSRFVRQEGSTEGLKPIGSLTIRDLQTGDLIQELGGVCSFNQLSSIAPSDQQGCREFPDEPFPFGPHVVQWSPDGSTIVAANPGLFTSGRLVVWDAKTGRVVHTRALEAGQSVSGMLFLPGGGELLVSLSGRGDSTLLERIDVASWQVIETIELDSTLQGAEQIGFLGFDADGSLIALGGTFGQGPGAIHWMDPNTLEIVKSQNQIHEGTLRMGTVNPGGTLVATSATDGVVRVWDATSGQLVHQIPFGDTSVQAVAFLDDSHLTVGTSGGQLTTHTLDVNELLKVMRDTLTRGFTDSECQRFNFDDDCPTLEELRS